jgi:hypothetical protein
MFGLQGLETPSHPLDAVLEFICHDFAELIGLFAAGLYFLYLAAHIVDLLCEICHCVGGRSEISAGVIELVGEVNMFSS